MAVGARQRSRDRGGQRLAEDQAAADHGHGLAHPLRRAGPFHQPEQGDQVRGDGQPDARYGEGSAPQTGHRQQWQRERRLDRDRPPQSYGQVRRPGTRHRDEAGE